MQLSPLTAISPADGRYHSKTSPLSAYFSEYALIKYRVRVEVEYFLALLDLELPQLEGFQKKDRQRLTDIYKNFELPDAHAIKKIEKITNHDVKAVEYFLREKFEELSLSRFSEFIHFGLTSQDINNTAMPLATCEAFSNQYLPELEEVTSKLRSISEEWWEIPMLARTHGQAATPTKLGKEIMVFVERLEGQIEIARNSKFRAKFGGATGNFNAHHVAYPKVDWEAFADKFVDERLGLTRYRYTTQIEHYDHLAAFFDALRRINTILIDFCRDVWTYISIDYFGQKVIANEVGSSAMPHKVNPIDFENAEGNLGIANALLEHFSSKLPISRLQRDLTDSTVIRNVGLPFAHASIAFQSILKGLGKLTLNSKKIHDDLDKNWVVLAEAIQTILRREGIDNPYDKLKAFTRKSESPGRKELMEFIETLEVRDDVKEELRKLSPFNYTGIF